MPKEHVQYALSHLCLAACYFFENCLGKVWLDATLFLLEFAFLKHFRDEKIMQRAKMGSPFGRCRKLEIWGIYGV